MAIADAEYVLIPNIYDGKQRSWDPDGTWREDGGTEPPPDGGLIAPTALGADQITTNSARISWSLSETRHTGQEAQQWIEGTSTSWTSHPLPYPFFDKDVREGTVTGLPDDTTIRIRIRCYTEE